MMPEIPLDDLKSDLRRRMRARRRAAHDPEAGQGLLAAFPLALLGLSPVAGYWPTGSEIDSRPLLEALFAQGAQLSLPRVDDRAQAPRLLAWRPGAALSADAAGAPAPDPQAEEVIPRLILCPLLAFDRRGHRLGQGGGHYDRLLAGLRPRGVIAVGLAFAAQEVVEIPAEPHDQRLDWIVTERWAIRIGGD